MRWYMLPALPVILLIVHMDNMTIETAETAGFKGVVVVPGNGHCGFWGSQWRASGPIRGTSCCNLITGECELRW